MMISIIIPIYNIEKYVSACIESVLSQTFTDFEAILVDDGSFDRCPEICDRYAEGDRRINVLHKENGGLLSARCAGISIASGDHIMYVDGDDWLKPDCLEKVVAALDETDADLICFGSESVYPDRTEYQLYPYEGLYDRARIEKELFPVLIEDARGHHLHSSIWGKVFRKDRLSEIMKYTDQRITLGEDGVVVRPYLFTCSSVCFLDASLYCYNRCNQSSMTLSLKPVDWDNTLLIRNRLLSVFPSEGDWLFQINRNTCHNAFITVLSRFNRDASFGEIVSDIKKHLADESIRSAVRSCRYSGLAGKLTCFLIRHKWILPVFLYFKMSGRQV